MTEQELSNAMKTYGDTVYRLALCRTQNAADAEDVYQDVFLRLLGQKTSGWDGEHLKAWLIRTALNRCADLGRLRRRRGETLSLEEVPDMARPVDETAAELLEKFGLKDKAKNYPCELSGGQCQRVAIARAMALKPDILCFDEPTSALDPELTGEVLKVIRDLKRDSGITMIIVTHEMEFARGISDKVLFMAEGRALEYGTPEKIFAHPETDTARQFLQNYFDGKNFQEKEENDE